MQTVRDVTALPRPRAAAITYLAHKQRDTEIAATAATSSSGLMAERLLQARMST